MGSGQSKHRITAQDKAILDMKVQRDKLKQYQKRLQAVLDREDALARELLIKGDKRRALLALRRRKFQTQTIQKTDEQLFNLQQLMETIEFSLVQKDIMFGLEQGSKVLGQLNKEMRIEDVERLADDTAEGIAYQNEVEDILQTNMTAEDEEAVMAELEQLEKQEADRLALSMPKAPTHKMPEREQSRVDARDDVAEDESEDEERARNEPLLA